MALNIQEKVGAGEGNRTPVLGLENRRTNRCTTPARHYLLKISLICGGNSN